MESTSLPAVSDELLSTASSSDAGRAGRTLHGGHDHFLRQTVIALVAGHELSEHESPGEATLQVLRGRVKLIVGDDTADAAAGDHLVIPPARHSLTALEDAVVLLTVLADRDKAVDARVR
jgi:quercetin dioxygenase-like cupin family protein